MTSETQKTRLVEQIVSEEQVPKIIRLHCEGVRKKANGNFISAIYALTKDGPKWVSVQKNNCHETITVKSNYFKELDNVVSNADYVERKFAEHITNGFENYQFYKFIR